jgi:DNA-binding transcriptional ArsR family regulator
MTQPPNKPGLMQAQSPETSPVYDSLIAPLFRSSRPRSIEAQLHELSEANRNTVLLLVRHGQMLSRMHDFGAEVSSYSELLGQAYPQVSSHLKSLAVAILDRAVPLPEPQQPRQVRPTPREQALEELYGPISAAPTQQPDPQPQPTSDFLERLTASESSGRSDAEITVADGRRFVGKLQFGEARLRDYQRSTGISFTQDEFKADPALQDKVAAWHFADIDKAIAGLGDAAKGYDRDGLKAVAHLGGVTGMKRFVRSKGDYDPSDALGTSLSDYYAKFSEAKS